MTITQILVANSSQAHMYKSHKAKILNGDANLELVGEFLHPESRKKNSELGADRSGSYSNPKSAGNSTFMESSNLKEQEADLFAKELSRFLEKGRLNNDFQELIVIAPAHFQGLLGKHFNSNIQSMVYLNIEKDYPDRMLNTPISENGVMGIA